MMYKSDAIVLKGHSPLDFYEVYARPALQWAKDAINQPNHHGHDFESRSVCLMKAINAYLKTGKSLDDLRDEIYVYLEYEGFKEDDNDSDLAKIMAWFIFKEENNGTTNKIGIRIQ